MANNEIPDYPKKAEHTVPYEIARTAIDATSAFIPASGYALGKLVDHFIQAPLQKKRDEWFDSVAAKIRELCQRIDAFDVNTLSENEDFISAIYEATHIAMRTAKREKLEYLNNGILNIATGLGLDDVLRGSAFSYIDRFSLLHIEVLRIMAAPNTYAGARLYATQRSIGGTQFEMIKRALEIEISEDVLDFITVELQVAMFVNVGQLKTNVSPDGLMQKLTRPAGDEFLRFISSPIMD